MQGVVWCSQPPRLTRRWSDAKVPGWFITSFKTQEMSIENGKSYTHQWHNANYKVEKYIIYIMLQCEMQLQSSMLETGTRVPILKDKCGQSHKTQGESKVSGEGGSSQHLPERASPWWSRLSRNDLESGQSP